MSDVFISRQPLVNRQSHIIATRLRLNLGENGSLGDMSDAVRVLNAVSDLWPKGQKPVFVGFGATACEATLLDWGSPENATLEIRACDLVTGKGAELVSALKDWQPSVCLHFDTNVSQALATGVSIRFIAFDRQTFTLPQIKLLAARTRNLGIGIAVNVEQSEDFYACMDAGLAAAASWFFLKPGPASAKALNPGQANLVCCSIWCATMPTCVRLKAHSSRMWRLPTSYCATSTRRAWG